MAVQFRRELQRFDPSATHPSSPVGGSALLVVPPCHRQPPARRQNDAAHYPPTQQREAMAWREGGVCVRDQLRRCAAFPRRLPAPHSPVLHSPSLPWARRVSARERRRTRRQRDPVPLSRASRSARPMNRTPTTRQEQPCVWQPTVPARRDRVHGQGASVPHDLRRRHVPQRRLLRAPGEAPDRRAPVREAWPLRLRRGGRQRDDRDQELAAWFFSVECRRCVSDVERMDDCS